MPLHSVMELSLAYNKKQHSHEYKARTEGHCLNSILLGVNVRLRKFHYLLEFPILLELVLDDLPHLIVVNEYQQLVCTHTLSFIPHWLYIDTLQIQSKDG